jgi:hypothetical protein
VSHPGDADYGTARLVLADLVDTEKRYRHDTERLAAAVMRAYFERDLRVQVAPSPSARPIAQSTGASVAADRAGT